MPVWAVGLLADAAVGEAADARLPDGWMVLLLLPAVRLGAAVLVAAAVGVLSDEVFSLPVLAKVRLVSIVLGFTAKILPIVGIDAQLFIVLIGERAPGCLKVKHVEISIRLHAMQQIYRQLLLRMSKCAKERAILARLDMIGVALTKFRLIFFGMIKLFHPIMCHLTIISHGALVALRRTRDHGAHAAGVLAEVPPPILRVVVVVQASFGVVAAAAAF